MAAAKKPRPQADRSPEGRAVTLHAIMTELGLAAVRFVPQSKLEDMAQHWLTGGRVAQDEDRFARAAAEALSYALDVALFTPSASGATAIDRFARQHATSGPDEEAALMALRRATFRVLRVEGNDPQGGHDVRDLATGEAFRLIDEAFPNGLAGLAIAARLAPLEGGIVVPVGPRPITPLDSETLAIAEARMRPGGRGLTNPNRCAEAIYRHVVRFGAPEIEGINLLHEEDADAFPFTPDHGPLHELAFAWSELAPGTEPPSADIQAARELLTEENLLEALVGCAAARESEATALADAYERILTLQLETAERRAALGLASALPPLDALGLLLDQVIADRLAPASVKAVFEQVRRRISVTGLGRQARPHSAELDKVLARIQGLRAKTVDRGCTEEEAMAAAEKVAELLDRHGLSLSEIELKSQACEGFGVGTGRRRFGPIDTCIPTIGLFCDCRVWTEQGAEGEIRYVFFGLPADVAGARYLHELIERAFETETDLFKRGELYARHRSADRRSATRSFQTGLAHGIVGKLHLLRERRDAVIRTETGRDLVPVKEAVIDDELAKLGLSFHKRGGTKRTYVLQEAYQAGQEAGERFEHRPGIGQHGADGGARR